MNKELLMLILGVFFLLFGLFFSRAYAWKQLFPYIPILVGLLLIYITTIGPLSNKAIKSRVLEVKSIKGSEVKSLRDKKANINGAYCVFINNELFVKDVDISMCRIMLGNSAYRCDVVEVEDLGDVQ
jgi:hypothetical protein